MDSEEVTLGVRDFLQSILQIEWLSTALTIVVALVFTALLAHAVTKLLRHVLSHDDVPLPSSSIFVNIARVAIWAIGISVVLSSFTSFDVSAAITALGIGGIAISLGFQDTLSNLIGGLQVSIMGIVQPGDHIDVGGQRGIVHDVTWRHTAIDTLVGERIVIPNSVINKTSLVRLPPQRKLVVPISVITQGDAMDVVSEKIRAATKEALRGKGTMEGEPSVLFTAITEFGYTGSIVVWMEEGVDVLDAKDAIVRAVAPLTRHEIRGGDSEGLCEEG